MKFIATVAGLGLAAILSGCASYQAQPIDPVERQNALRQRAIDEHTAGIALERLAGTGLFEGESVTIEPADGLEFKEAFLAALALSPSLEQKRSVTEEYAAYAEAAAGFGGIMISGGDDDMPEDRRGMAMLKFDILSVFPSERKRARIASANADAVVTLAQLHQAQWTLFVDLREAFARHELLQREIAGYERLSAAFDERVRKPGLELARLKRVGASVALMIGDTADALDVRLRALYSELQLASNRIKQLIGLSPASPVWFSAVPLRAPDEAALAAIHARAVARRWDLQLALAEYQVVEENLRLAVAEQYPQIRLGPAFRFGEGPEVFGGAIDIDIPDPVAAGGRIKGLEARRRELRFAVEDALLQIEHAAANAREQLRAADRNERQWRADVLPRAQELLDVRLRQLKLQPDTLGEALDAFAEQSDKIKEYWMLETARVEAALALERAAGYPVLEENK